MVGFYLEQLSSTLKGKEIIRGIISNALKGVISLVDSIAVLVALSIGGYGWPSLAIAKVLAHLMRLYFLECL